MTLDQIWEMSRNNNYSWMLPFIISMGLFILVLLNGIRKPSARRVLKIVFAIGFTYLAIHASSMAISEKWRIRQEWGEKNWDSLTKEEQQALGTDGANLVLGPILDGGAYAFWLFGVTLVASRVIRKIIQKKKSSKTL